VNVAEPVQTPDGLILADALTKSLPLMDSVDENRFVPEKPLVAEKAPEFENVLLFSCVLEGENFDETDSDKLRVILLDALIRLDLVNISVAKYQYSHRPLRALLVVIVFSYP
jgi:hypothetical protein